MPDARRPVKTVVIVHDYGDVRGGQEKVAIDSALGLKASGLDVLFFCATEPTDLRLAASGINVVSLNISDLTSNPSKMNAARKGFWNTIPANRLKEALAEYDPESTVIHVHGWTKALSASIGPVVTDPKRRHIYTMHEYFLACPNGGFFNYQTNKICKLRAMGSECIRTNCDQRSYLQKAFRITRQAVATRAGGLPNRLKNIIYISDLQKSVMAPYLSEDTNLHYVPNPITVPKDDRVKAERNQKIVFVGRLEPVKGALDLAKAASQVSLPVAFVGDGIQAEHIRNVCPNAEITGWVTPDDVYAHLRSARCLVFPSLWYECQPLVPYEALAMGVPIVSYDTSAARESIYPGLNGEIVAHSEKDTSFAEVLMKFEDDEIVKERSIGAYNTYWSKPLTIERHVAALLDVYSMT